MPSFEWREHTAELELVVFAASEEQLFQEALRAFTGLVALEEHGDPASFEIQLEGNDRGGLLVQWLDEMIYLADAHSFLPDVADPLMLRPDGVAATIRGRRRRYQPLVKAATYHGLDYRRLESSGDSTDPERWEAHVVVDV